MGRNAGGAARNAGGGRRMRGGGPNGEAPESTTGAALPYDLQQVSGQTSAIGPSRLGVSEIIAPRNQVFIQSLPADRNGREQVAVVRGEQDGYSYTSHPHVVVRQSRKNGSSYEVVNIYSKPLRGAGLERGERTKVLARQLSRDQALERGRRAVSSAVGVGRGGELFFSRTEMANERRRVGNQEPNTNVARLVNS